ncbi:MAG: peptidoglycan DD-metalloendopeptidase family protein, partial [Chloroflexi bacterium]|nr:peptidoglycan DD-metalloendopeptidase family protein [Chloroflexota bacterium]
RNSSLLSVIAAFVFASGFLPAAEPSEVEAAPPPPLQLQQLTVPGLPATALIVEPRALEAYPVTLTTVTPPVAAGELLEAADRTGLTLAALEEKQSRALARVAVPEARTPQVLPKFFRYEITAGDTISGIAQKFGVRSDFIIWNNIHVVDDADLLTIGDVLRVPSVEGILHDVRFGQTLTEIAEIYEAAVQDILDFPANAIANPNVLTEGDTLLVVGGERIPPPWQSSIVIVSREASSTGFIWPVVDLITSYFGPTHPLGIDINAPYVPVAAAQAGQVVFAGGDLCCSYGLYVDIVHAGGYETRYAHFSEVYVSIGETVAQGQIIGVSGNTGRSTGPHVHFEIRRNGYIVNPLRFLP